MWEMYRKRMVATQVLVVIVCAVIYFYFKRGWPQVLATLVVMELAGIAGAWWTFRLKTRIEASQNKLPLERRR